MHWKHLRKAAWLDTRARFLMGTPKEGTHLDAGCSSCKTLKHLVELRPDLRFTGLDYEDFSQMAPKEAQFVRANLITDTLPFANGSFDSISLMHVMEHLPDPGKAPREFTRILKPGGRLYVEGPGPRSLLFPSSSTGFTLNFYDDPTHIAPLSKGRIANVFGGVGFKLVRAGVSRSLVLIGALPLSLMQGNWYHLMTGLCHLGGWTVYCEFRRD